MSDFPLPDEHGVTRVPNAVISALLDGDVARDTINFVLRAVWWLDRSREYPRSVYVSDLRADRTLVSELGGRFDDAKDSALTRGIFVANGSGAGEKLMLNTVSAIRHAEDDKHEPDATTNGWSQPADQPSVADAYGEYEANIAPLTPMIRESISDALQDFTDEQIVSAVRIAVESDSRSWSFIAAVLRKWSTGGVPSEHQSSGDSRGSRLSEDDLQRYLKEQR